MKNYFLIILIIWSGSNAIGQVSKDSLLANERTMDRPLNVHGGQLRVTGSYGYEYRTKEYDAGGASMDLKTDGLAYSNHLAYFELKYGITEYLQLTAALQHQSSLQRERQRYLIGYPDINSFTYITTTHKYAGGEDLYLSLDYRIPLKTKKIDVLVNAGVFIPVSEHQQPEPSHSFEEKEENFWQLSYRNEHPLGRGTSTVALGGALKYRFTNWAITLSGLHQHAMNEVEELTYSYQILPNNQFEYETSSYIHTLPDILTLNALLEYQASSYLNIFLSADHFSTSNGWRQMEEGQLLTDEQSLTSAGPGFELIVTPRIWFRETINIPVSAKNTESGVQFLTTLYYNLILKK